MNLKEAKLNTTCVVKDIKISNEKMKLRLMELGLNTGTKVKVFHKSILKKTLLLFFNASCFTMKDDIASEIEVSYA